MQVEAFKRWLVLLEKQAKRVRHRHLVILQGQTDWAEYLLSSVGGCFFSGQENADDIKSLTYGNMLPFQSPLYSNQYQHHLGTECHYVVYADKKINLNLISALSGSIVAGGILFIVITPEVIETNSEDNLFQWFMSKLKLQKNTYFISQEDKEIAKVEHSAPSDIETIEELGFCKTQEQLLAVNAVKKVMTGHRNRPLVLTADRGRGKSSALAIACAELVMASNLPLHIVITAPHQQSVQIFFQQLKNCLPDGQKSQTKFTLAEHTIEFLPVDQLLAKPAKVSLLLVDEAAAIPVYLLIRLLSHYHRVVFSSTQHGYEGAGRGFTLKFQQYLQQHFSNANLLHINEPIRWAVNDPLEQTIFSLCLFNAELPDLSLTTECLKTKKCHFQHITTRELMQDEALFKKVFSLLVTAHYQTSPTDIEMMLNNPNVSVSAYWYQQELVAVALLMKEGLLPESDVTAIRNNQRRIKDQFLPQSLLTHNGIKQAFDYQYLRVMRIAVHPEIQGIGIGKSFLDDIIEYAKTESFDFVGTSFGVNEQLLSFWLSKEFTIARIGFTQDKASGEYSAILLRSLTKRADTLLNEISDDFYRSFDYLLPEVYSNLATELVVKIIAQAKTNQLPPMLEKDFQAVEDFISGERQYLSCLYSLHLWLMHMIAVNKCDDNIYPAISKVLHKKPSQQLCEQYGFTGKKQIIQYLKDLFSKYYSLR